MYLIGEPELTIHTEGSVKGVPGWTFPLKEAAAKGVFTTSTGDRVSVVMPIPKRWLVSDDAKAKIIRVLKREAMKELKLPPYA